MTHDPEFRRLFVNRLWTNILHATDRNRPAADRGHARRFLVSGAGFEPACIRAGLDPARVRQHTLNLIGPAEEMKPRRDSAVATRERRKPRASGASKRPPVGSTLRRLEHDGRSMTIEAWATELGVNHKTIRARLSNGWSVVRTLTQPAIPRPRRNRGVGRASDAHGGTGAHPTAKTSAELGFFQ